MVGVQLHWLVSSVEDAVAMVTQLLGRGGHWGDDREGPGAWQSLAWMLRGPVLLRLSVVRDRFVAPCP